MTLLQLAILTWACTATALCLFIHGAKKDREARGRVREELASIQWPIGYKGH